MKQIELPAKYSKELGISSMCECLYTDDNPYLIKNLDHPTGKSRSCSLRFMNSIIDDYQLYISKLLLS